MRHSVQILILILALATAGCTITPAAHSPAAPPADPLGTLLEAGEQVAFRAPAQLLHGHDMEEPPYDTPEGYRPIPGYRGELAVTDRRLLFVVLPAGPAPSWMSIPFAAITRARPSRTPLLNYIVVWDRDNQPNAFMVDARHVRALHQHVGQALIGRPAAGNPGQTVTGQD